MELPLPIITFTVIILIYIIVKVKKNSVNNIHLETFKYSITRKNIGYEIFLFDQKMDWNTAVECCRNLGNELRLPSKSEFELFYIELYDENIWELGDGYFWSGSICNNSNLAFVARFPRKDLCSCIGTIEKLNKCRVIAIREIPNYT